MSVTPQRERVLTGDTPTGSLHLGHYVGSIENRLAMQEEYDCFFFVANVHAMTTRVEDADGIRSDTIQIVKDWLACGIDPGKATLFIQSEIPAVAELTWYFAMLLGYGQLMRNPTIHHEIETKGLGDKYSFGFLMYPVGQMADILAFRPRWVPVGEDQVPHIEMTRDIAARFNLLYCGDASVKGNLEKRLKRLQKLEDAAGVFPLPQAKIGRVARLTGIDGKNKMSKSLGNAIFLTDDPATVLKKCNKIFTGRGSMTDPPVIEGNTVIEYLDVFHADKARVAELKDGYRLGQVGDGAMKKEVAEQISALLEPIQKRRAALGDDDVIDVLRAGTAKANAVAEETLALAKKAARLDFFPRSLSIG